MFPLAKGHMKITLALITLIPILFFYSLLYNWLIYFIPSVILILAVHLFFFRDPARETIEDSKIIFAPADGKVYEVLPDEGIIRIRMSLFNVHVNRWPVSGKITKISQQSGKYWPFVSFLRRGTDENARQIIELEEKDEIFEITQISGIFARRCVTYASVGDIVFQGQKLGMIYYGSEVDIRFPVSRYDILIHKNDTTIAGVTVLAKVKDR
ncbi:MAG: phosphatidylserine decarboxylase [Promethearchaeota archaeon]